MRDGIPEFWLDVLRSTEYTSKLAARVVNVVSQLGSGHFGRGVECRQLDRLLLRKSMIKQCVRTEEAMHRLNKDVMTASQAQDMQAGGSLDDVRVVRDGGQGVAAGGFTTHQESFKNPGGAFQLCGRRLALPACFRSGIHHAIMRCLSRTEVQPMYAYALPRRSSGLFEASRGPAAAATFLFGTAATAFYPVVPVDGGGRICGSSSNDTIFGKCSRLALSLASSTPATTFNPLAAVARPAHVSPAAPHPNSRPVAPCTLCPAAQTDCQMLSDVPVGIPLNDGFQFLQSQPRDKSCRLRT